MKKIKLLPIILLACLLMSALGLPALALEEPELSSSYAVLMDADSGRIFYQKDADTKAYPASLTKVMTVLVAVEAVERGEFSLTDSVTASETCLEGMVDDGSTAGIVPGETMPLQDLLYCALLASANEACNLSLIHILLPAWAWTLRRSGWMSPSLTLCSASDVRRQTSTVSAACPQEASATSASARQSTAMMRLFTAAPPLPAPGRTRKSACPRPPWPRP